MGLTLLLDMIVILTVVHSGCVVARATPPGILHLPLRAAGASSWPFAVDSTMGFVLCASWR